MSSGALAGLRILDLTRLLPGGYATLLMADLGADVVKIEEPGKGDYIRWTPPMVGEFSASHIALNRNKRSVTLNLKQDEGRLLFLDLVKSFDVVIESFRPGVMERLGIGWSALSKIHPGLIYCAISGYGQDGPRSLEAGHDANYIGFAGVLGMTGEEGRRPVIPGIQVGDLAGGGMAAVIAILAALHRRSSTGAGEFCDIAMADGAFSWLTIHAAEFVATKRNPQRELMHLSGAYPCYRVYPAADGYISVGALEPQFWSALCEAIDRQDLLGDGFAVEERRREVIDDLDAFFATRTRAEWRELLAGRDVCVGPINNFEEAFADPQLRHRGMVVTEDLPSGESWDHIGNPIKLSGEEARLIRMPPPGLGEHSDEVLKEAGISSERVNELRSAGVV